MEDSSFKPASASNASGASNADSDRSTKLSYKFQRLRERLRQAVASGELSGKLPGERQLARKFRVNAKTLSKALTDLAAEGVLDRSIGRGTFVRSPKAAAQTTAADRWLIITDPGRESSQLIHTLTKASPGSQVVTETSSLRPSFLNQFKGIVNLSKSTPESFLRDLVVRNMGVVLVDREPETYSMHAVVFDRALAASRLAREMILAGHSRFLAVEVQGQHLIADTIRATAMRLDTEVTVEPVYPNEVASALPDGITAVITDSATSASEVIRVLDEAGVSVPSRISVAAVDCAGSQLPCSGYCIDPDQEAQSVIQILRDQKSRRPMTLWLAGSFQDHGTVGPVTMMMEDAGRAQPAVRSLQA